MIRRVTQADADAICEIYNYYILNTAITFETQEVDRLHMVDKINTIVSGNYPFFVYEENGMVLGYCYLNMWNKKSAYDSTAELSIYIHKDSRGQGIGHNLLRLMLDVCDRTRFHSIVSCITLPNEHSVKLHEKMGFAQVAYFREVGLKFGKWHNVGHWQLIFSDNTASEESCPCGANSFCRC